MGSLREGEGDGRPPPDKGGLPDLPPEWGKVVVPDDLAELDREAAEFRKERRRASRAANWRRRMGLAPRSENPDAPPVGVPLIIMSIAIIAALTSLFAITLSTRTSPNSSAPPSTTPTAAAAQQMIDLALSDNTGQTVRIRDNLPAVILLLDGCACADLIAGAAAAAPANVNVIAVDKAAPYVPSTVHALALADPEQALLATYSDGPDRGASPAGQPTAVFVGKDGSVTQIISPALSVEDIRSAFTELMP